MTSNWQNCAGRCRTKDGRLGTYMWLGREKGCICRPFTTADEPPPFPQNPEYERQWLFEAPFVLESDQMAASGRPKAKQQRAKSTNPRAQDYSIKPTLPPTTTKVSYQDFRALTQEVEKAREALDKAKDDERMYYKRWQIATLDQTGDAFLKWQAAKERRIQAERRLSLAESKKNNAYRYPTPIQLRTL